MDIRVVPKQPVGPPADASSEAAPGDERKHVYLRTIYPLNAGIPHAVDFPEGWEPRDG